MSTGIGFLDHMLEQLSRHSLIDLEVKAKGDLHIDFHHTTEDFGIVIGEAVNKALGERKGIVRYGSRCRPSTRRWRAWSSTARTGRTSIWKVNFSRPKLGDMDTELFKEWFQAFAQAAGLTLHVETLYGENNHHIVETLLQGSGPGAAPGDRDRPAQAKASFPRPRARSRSEPQGRVMRVYTVHMPRRLRRASASRSRDIVLVKEGFSWPAFFFSVAWALWCRLWLVASAGSSAHRGGGRRGAGRRLGADPVTQAAISLALRLVIGLVGNDLKRWTLWRRGYVEGDVVTGEGGDAAERRFFDRHPEIGRGARPVIVAIVDYGSGNLRSAAKAFERAVGEAGLDADVEVTADPADILARRPHRAARRRRLRRLPAGLAPSRGWSRRSAARSWSRAGRSSASASACSCWPTCGREHGDHAGLGWIPGEVTRIAPSDPALKIPHMGWNELVVSRPDHPLLGRHRRPAPTPISSTPTVSSARVRRRARPGRLRRAGRRRSSARDNIVGMQFHPEKSQARRPASHRQFPRSWRP